MNGRKVVLGAVLLAAGSVGVVGAGGVLLAGDPSSLPVLLLGGVLAVLGTAVVRSASRAPAPRRGARRVPPSRHGRHDAGHTPYAPSGHIGADHDHGSDGERTGWWGGDSGGGWWSGGGDSGGGSFGGGGGDGGGGGGSS
ncbi:hypothetical protein NCC78_15030 [Micromonospora phytophila]|uniref:hypothetical protein n=1 Tax=Micromonospora phytophila TaxID=709888 RepID=UPI00202F5326|nr:hypothetical protein [Micromonospora phytophila]MCM0675994.1 hypothetical protein [Micromonospora phytophila]